MKVIFIHVNKCGGTSIKKCLRPNPNVLICTNAIPGSRYNIHDVQKRKIWKDAFTFTVIRHPFARLVSAYKMFNTENPAVTLQQVIDITLDKTIGHNSLHDFKKRVKRHTLPITHPHYGIVDKNDAITVDFVARLENITEDWKVVEEKLGKQVPLPHANKTNNQNIQLSKDQEQLLYEYYHKDFLIFGYNKI
jgi:hypothetical protein